MKIKTSLFMTLAVGATVAVGLNAFAGEAAAVAQVPQNLVSAESIDAQVQSATQNAIQADESAATSDESADEAFLGRGGAPNFRPAPMPRGGGSTYRPVARPVIRPIVYPRPGVYPRPFQRPIFYPRPIPYFGAPIFTCYAQSPANGLTYPGTAYYGEDAQTVALNTCADTTGYECVATGCN